MSYSIAYDFEDAKSHVYTRISRVLTNLGWSSDQESVWKNESAHLADAMVAIIKLQKNAVFRDKIKKLEVIGPDGKSVDILPVLDELV